MMFVRRFAALLLILAPVASLAAGATITADQWASPRSGERVARLPGLGQVIAGFNAASVQIVIHYAPGESGTLWAEELRSWLIALGIPSARISLRSSLARADIISIETESR